MDQDFIAKVRSDRNFAQKVASIVSTNLRWQKMHTCTYSNKKTLSAGDLYLYTKEFNK